MLDPKQLLDQFLGGGAGQPQDRANAEQGGGGALDAIPQSLKGFGGGLAAGGIAGLLLGGKGGRKMVGKAAKIGGMAVLGGLAYKAYRDWQGGQSGGSPTEPADTGASETAAQGTPFLPAPVAERNELGVKLLQAMIAAAKADGHIDAEEQANIFAKLDDTGLGTEEKAFLMDELRRPLDIDAIVALAESEEQAVEIYAASRLAIDPDEPAEQAYLTMLAARLKIAPELKDNIERELAAAIN